MVNVLDFVEVEQVATDRFRPVSGSPLARRTLFGGALVAQALRSAGLTVDADKFPDSLHASFLRAGRSDLDLEYRVDRVRDGRAFATRQVTAVQGERVIMIMTASFHRDEPGPEYGRAPAAVPVPEQAVGRAAHMSGNRHGLDVVEFGTDTGSEFDGGLTGPASAVRYLAWGRAQHRLPDDRVVHACVMAFLSDSGAPGVTAHAIGITASGPDGEGGPGNMTTSLDHAMWFHRDGRIDDWVLLEGIPMSTAGSRGLLMGTMHDRDGRHLVTFTQEMLIRLAP